MINKHDLMNATYLTDLFWADMTGLLHSEYEASLKRGLGVNDAVRSVRLRWDKLRAVTRNNVFQEKAWKYFYATRVAPLKRGDVVQPVIADSRNPVSKILSFLFANEPWSAKKKPRRKIDAEVHCKLQESILQSSKPKQEIPEDVRLAAQKLGVVVGTLTLECIKRAFAKRVMKVHPDKGGTEVMFTAVNDARSVLIDWLDGRKV